MSENKLIFFSNFVKFNLCGKTNELEESLLKDLPMINKNCSTILIDKEGKSIFYEKTMEIKLKEN